jgi:hypothetical protein
MIPARMVRKACAITPLLKGVKTYLDGEKAGGPAGFGWSKRHFRAGLPFQWHKGSDVNHTSDFATGPIPGHLPLGHSAHSLCSAGTAIRVHRHYNVPPPVQNRAQSGSDGGDVGLHRRDVGLRPRTRQGHSLALITLLGQLGYDPREVGRRVPRPVDKQEYRLGRHRLVAASWSVDMVKKEITGRNDTP